MPRPAVIQLTSPGLIAICGAETVAVHDLAVEKIGHGGEPDMRMRANVEPVACVKLRRSEMIEKDERADHACSGGRQCTPDREIAEIDRARHDDLGNSVALICVAGGRILAREETHDRSYSLLSPQSEQPQRIAACDPLRLIGRKLGEPSAIFLEDRVVAEPALIDPGVGAEQEPVGITCK